MAELRERFGKYHVLERIAQGGMAEIYKVKTVGIAGFEKVQALKRIKPQSAGEERFIRGFIDEARIAVELSHRNIVQVYDFGKADGELYLAMELVEGVDLRTALTHTAARAAPVPVAVAAYVVSEAAAGLDYAHRKTDGLGRSLGIVHCDVSPANVMLSYDGYVKVLDFGIARASFSSALERRRLRGKPRYMAPEQTYGETPTAASDVFALAVIAWELFAGRALFTGADLRAVLGAVRRCEVPPLASLTSGLPVAVTRVIDRALSPDPADRGSAADLAGTLSRLGTECGARGLAGWLEALLRDEAAPWPTGEFGRDEVAAARAGVSAAAVSAAAAASAGVVTTTASRPTSARAPAPPRSGRAAVTTSTRRRGLADGSDDFADDQSTAQAGPAGAFASGPATGPGTRSSLIGLRPLPEPGEPGFEEETTSHQPRGRGAETRSTATGAIPFDEAELRFDIVEDGDDRPEFAPAIELAGGAPIDDPLVGDASAAVVERRRVAVVVIQLVAGEGGVERARALARGLGELAYQRGGVALSLSERALVVVFGLEVAGEDDAVVALAWALDAAARARDEGVGASAGVRLGVGAPLDQRGRPAVDPVGITEATRLAAEALPGRPRVAGALGRAAAALFELRALTGGDDRPREVEVSGRRDLAELGQAVLRRRGRFVGRADALAALEAAMVQAERSGHRVSALCLGAAGVGKSRLCAELVARLEAGARPPRVLAIATSAAARSAPFAVVIDLVLAGLGLPAVRGRAGRARLAERLPGALQLARPDPDAAVDPGPQDAEAAAEVEDHVAALMGAVELRDGVTVGHGETADLRARVADALAALRRVLHEPGRPLLILIEDVHLADNASLEVLRRLTTSRSPGAELLVLTAREGGPPLPPVDVVVTLPDLVGAELRALVVDRLGPVATPFAVAAVISRAGGNPLLVEELARATREDGDALPDSAREVVAARATRLGPGARAVLRYAAVLGTGVRTRLLEELVGGELSAELDELAHAGLLTARDPERPADAVDGELVFARGLLREVVYDGLSARSARDFHGQVGRLLATRALAGRDEPPAVVAEHLERGGEVAAAAAFWLRAGRLAMSAHDATAAVGYFGRTLALERQLGPEPASAPGRQRRIEALAGREEAHRLLGDLTRDGDDLDELMRLADRDLRRQADVILRRAQRALGRGDLAAALAGADQAEKLAQDAGDLRLRGDAVCVRGEALERSAHYQPAEAALRQARTWYAQLGATRAETAAMMVQARMSLLRGQIEAARDLFRAVVSRLPRLRDPVLERTVRMHIALAQLHLGNYADAMTSARRALELCKRFGDRAREGETLATLGVIHAALGLYDQAAEHYAAALDLLDGTGSRWAYADCLVHAGACDVRRGHASGLDMIAEGARQAAAIGARYVEVHARLARAEAATRAGDARTAADDAAIAAAAARQATLAGFEAIALARQAAATAALGQLQPEPTRPGERASLASAAELAERAVALVGHLRYLDGSVEEVLLACAEVFVRCGARDQAAHVRERGRQGVLRKLRGIVDPTWRAAFVAVDEHAALLAEPEVA